MNLYLHHIGDFNNATRHLTRVERSVYSDAIDMYYDVEHALPSVDFDALARRLLCRSEEEKEALKTILAEFFVQTEAGFTHARCDEEIAKYRANTSAKARAGIASAAKRQQKTACVQQNSTCVEHTSTNRKPLTVNQYKQPSVVKRAAKKCPDDFEVTADMQAWAANDCPGVNVERATEKFRDHSFDKPKTDWLGTWKNWIRRDFDSLSAQSKLPAWREQQRAETLKAVPSIALGGVNPTTFFENLGAQNVAIARIR